MTECRSVFAALIMPQEAFCVIGETATKTRPQLDLFIFLVHFLVLFFLSLSVSIYILQLRVMEPAVTFPFSLLSFRETTHNLLCVNKTLFVMSKQSKFYLTCEY